MDLIRENLNEKLYYQKLSSGLEVYVLPKPFFAKKYVFFAVPFGGLHHRYMSNGKTHDIPKGLAHFLEHQVFENKDNPTFKQFEKIGASVNAYTSNQMTVYHFECVDRLKEGIGILMDMVLHARIDEASLSKEKKVIQQEIKMYEDDVYWELETALKGAMYHEHPIKDDIAGTFHSVENTTLEDLTRCYDQFYVPGNMKIFVYGDVDKEEVCQWIEGFQTEAYQAKKSDFLWLFPEEPKTIKMKNVILSKDIQQNKFLMGFKNEPFVGDFELQRKMAALRLANSMMFGDSSNFYKAMYDKGWLYDPMSYDVQTGTGYMKCVLGAETDHTKQVSESVLETLAYYQKHPFSEKDFIRNKKKLMGRFVFSFNSLQSIAGNITYSTMRGEDIFSMLAAYQNLKLEDLTLAVQTHYDSENFSYAELTQEEK